MKSEARSNPFKAPPLLIVAGVTGASWTSQFMAPDTIVSFGAHTAERLDFARSMSPSSKTEGTRVVAESHHAVMGRSFRELCETWLSDNPGSAGYCLLTGRLTELELLRDLSPRVRFLIFQTSVADAIAFGLAEGRNPDGLMEEWQDVTARALEFLAHNRSRAILVNATSLKQPELLGQALAKIGVESFSYEPKPTVELRTSALAHWLAQAYSTNVPALREIEGLLEAASEVADVETGSCSQPQVREAIADYLMLGASARAHDDRLVKLQESLAERKAAVERLRQRLDEMESSAGNLAVGLNEKERELEHARRNVRDLEGENERLNGLAAFQAERIKVVDRLIEQEKKSSQELLVELEAARSEAASEKAIRGRLECTLATLRDEHDMVVRSLHLLQENIAQQIQSAADSREESTEDAFPGSEAGGKRKEISQASRPAPWFGRFMATQEESQELPTHYNSRRRLKKHAKIIADSGLFDAKWYMDVYDDVKQAKVDPIHHYLRRGALEGRNPSSRFDTGYYLTCYPDVAESTMNPLVHYILFGQKEGRRASYTN